MVGVDYQWSTIEHRIQASNERKENCMTHDTFVFKEFPKIRHGYIDVLREGQRKRFIHGLFEVDVTDVRMRLGEYKTRTGETPSFTAFVIHCLGKAVDENKILHAMRQGRNKLVLFDEVDVSTQIEVEVDGHKIVKPHVVRAANRKSFREIHNEIRAAQVGKPEEEQKYQSMQLFLSLPRFIRSGFWRIIASQPQIFKKLGGTVGMSAIGMFADGAGWGIPISFPTLMITLGGIGEKPGVVEGRIEIREYLSLTVSVDHDIVDGAPATRFAKRLRELMETGNGIGDFIKYT
ncbi:MAG: 2-oxo acid dehydrogenase subunit E2 [Chloroflexi bacterium]|nr:2-oxo acid dehydrogenase subunit E2 [Chloroflexota bacterium]